MTNTASSHNGLLNTHWMRHVVMLIRAPLPAAPSFKVGAGPLGPRATSPPHSPRPPQHTRAPADERALQLWSSPRPFTAVPGLCCCLSTPWRSPLLPTSCSCPPPPSASAAAPSHLVARKPPRKHPGKHKHDEQQHLLRHAAPARAAGPCPREFGASGVGGHRGARVVSQDAARGVEDDQRGDACDVLFLKGGGGGERSSLACWGARKRRGCGGHVMGGGCGTVMPCSAHPPATANLRCSAARSPLLSNGTASHGCNLTYSPNSPGERSHDTKTTSNCWPAAFSVLYVAASWGVNARHGGHLW